ncbi:MAG: hypothetical protein ACTSRZ_07825, partial [Promethearchaeota archaeon]
DNHPFKRYYIAWVGFICEFYLAAADGAYLIQIFRPEYCHLYMFILVLVIHTRKYLNIIEISM